MFPAGDTRDPHLSYRAGLCAASTWGDAIRLATFTAADVLPPVIEPPPVEPPIVRITDVQPRSGKAPLDVRVTVSLSGGPCDAITVSATTTDVPEIDITVNDPAPTSTHTLRLTAAGVYDIASYAFGSATDSDEWPSAVIVNKPEDPPMPGKPYDEQFYLQTAAPDAIADYAAVNRPVDGQYAIWFTRTEHDYQNGLTLVDSWRKHRNEMRAALDPSGVILPPL